MATNTNTTLPLAETGYAQDDNFVIHRFSPFDLDLALAELARPVLDMDYQIGEIRRSYQGSSHPDTDAIVLRGPKDLSKASLCKPEDVTHYVSLTRYHETYRLVLKALARLGITGAGDIKNRLGFVMVARLRPYGKVLEHIDCGDYANRSQRYHITLSDGAAKFNVKKETGWEVVERRQGDFWIFPHKTPHDAVNETDAVRDEIVFDVFNEGV